MTTIGDSAFHGCSLEEVIIESPTVAANLTSNMACGKLIFDPTIVKVRDTITNIGSYLADTNNYTVTTEENYKVYTKI